MTDFFISYTSVDEEWAEWIGYTLEEEGFSVVLQAWDFRPGSNFVLEMQRAAKQASRTILVLSPDFLQSQFTSPEWASAFANDPQGLRRSLLPVMIRDCKPGGLLDQIVHINLAGLDQPTAKAKLLSGIRPERAKPTGRPSFPGKKRETTEVVSEPLELTSASAERLYVPRIQREPTDAEKRKFLRATFVEIQTYFEKAAMALSRSQSELEYEILPITGVEFTAELFLNGKSIAACRIWQGGMIAENGISYAEGRQNFSSNTCNEILSITNADGRIVLQSVLGSQSYDLAHIDIKNMSAAEAAEYLWRKFVYRLETHRR